MSMRTAKPCAALLALTIGAGVPAAASAIDVEAAKAAIEAEFGDPNVEPLAAHTHTAATLPGAWAPVPWQAYPDLTDEYVNQACQRVRIVIADDLQATLEYRRGDEVGTVDGRFIPMRGRLFSIVFDERQYVDGFANVPEAQRGSSTGLMMRLDAMRFVVLTPRSTDLIVGYDVFGGNAVLYLRCPED